MEKESGVSSNNDDVAPSLYDTTVNMSESLLDITSVSHNVPQTKQKPKSPSNTGMAINNFDIYKDTKFM